MNAIKGTYYLLTDVFVSHSIEHDVFGATARVVELNSRITLQPHDTVAPLSMASKTGKIMIRKILEAVILRGLCVGARPWGQCAWIHPWRPILPVG